MAMKINSYFISIFLLLFTLFMLCFICDFRDGADFTIFKLSPSFFQYLLTFIYLYYSKLTTRKIYDINWTIYYRNNKYETMESSFQFL